jgi:hypothetical protein
VQWSDVTRVPEPRTLRAFAGLCLLCFGGLAALRLSRGHMDGRTMALGVAALAIGIPGLLRPTLVRWIYTTWMAAAFPIGWTVSRVALAVLFYGCFTPIAVIFRLTGRDALRLRRTQRASYWTAKTRATSPDEYFRQT